MILNRPSATMSCVKAVTIAPDHLTTLVVGVLATKNPMSQTDTSPRLTYKQSPTTTTPHEKPHDYQDRCSHTRQAARSDYVH